MLNSHDRALLRDLKLQPLWLPWLYIGLGIAALSVGFAQEARLARLLCAGGGFLLALGAEKLVSRRIRSAALLLIADADSDVRRTPHGP